MLCRVSISHIPGSSGEGAITKGSVLVYVHMLRAVLYQSEIVVLQAGGEDAGLSFFRKNIHPHVWNL